MKALLNPRWLVLINQVPLVLLLLLFFSNYQIIKSLLEAPSVQLWQQFGLVLLILLFIHAAFTWISVRHQRELNSWYGLTTILVYTIFSVVYYSQAEAMIPRDIPSWMVADGFHLYLGTFLMPTLGHALLVLILNWSDPEKPKQAAQSFLYAVLIPGLMYLFALLIFPLWRGNSWPGGERVMIFLVLFATLVFFFFLVRAIYLATISRKKLFDKQQLLWKIPITILFPLLGLALNNGHLGNLSVMGGRGVFGDYSAPIFYILAVVNGVLLCLPDSENKLYRLPLLLARAATFGFTLYFFLVFLPFLPFAVLAILALGAGFLMLTPLALFVIHVDQLTRDYYFLKTYYQPKVVFSMLAIAFLILPVIIQVNYTQDQQNLKDAIDYVYNPDYEKTYDINRRELGRTIGFLRKHKQRGNNDFILADQLPYLSAYYNWLVLDNLTLSEKKINRLEAIFFDAPFLRSTPTIFMGSPFVETSDLQVESSYDEQAKVWRSWVHVELSNTGDLNLQEFNTIFFLPKNTWISDYYLYVGERKEMGLLTEKRTATWIFNQIRNTNRDPGILSYLDADNIGFRVFPFAQGEVRKTGIEFIHPEPVQLNFAGQNLQLGDKQVSPSIFAQDYSTASYLSSGFKVTLDSTYRTPYFHFILDGSEGNTSSISNYIRQIESLLQQYPSLQENARISWSNAYHQSIAMDQDWKAWLRKQPAIGGFFLEQSFRSIFVQHYQAQAKHYPIPIVLAETMEDALFEEDLSNLAFAFPETPLFYHLDDNSMLQQHSLAEKPWEVKGPATEITRQHPVLVWEKSEDQHFYLKTDQQVGSIVSDPSQDLELNPDLAAKSLAAALAQEAHLRQLILQPNAYPTEWLVQLQANFNSRIMSPISAYIVVENEAQKAMLLKKQNQVLDSNARFDLEEEVNNMSEPSLWIVLVLLLLFGYFRFRRQGLIA